MPQFSQSSRLLQITTPLGSDKLFVTGFTGTEQISNLFTFDLSLIADNSTDVDFSKIVGKEITLKIAVLGSGGTTDWRYVNGICSNFSEGDRNERFTSFAAQVVPKVWLLSRRARSRIFQQKSVPDILKAVFEGYDCDFQLRGDYQYREYCVQYRETDFNFASRLMEEEGIYYYFKHADGSHKMIIADTPQSHLVVPGLPNARYDVVKGAPQIGDQIFGWQKTQGVRAGKYTLWDHSFEQPNQNLEAKQNILDTVTVGTVSHKLKSDVNDPLEIYDFPGGYAVRFDGVSPSGQDQASRLQKIFDDNTRTVKLRMEAEALPSITITGTSGCSNFVAGHKFTLKRHFDAEGDYVIVSVTHQSFMSNEFVSGGSASGLFYSNSFTCIPVSLPYRPPRIAPKPFIAGVQNALITGPNGKEVFTDKYGRVKVQFYWDREGKSDENSSCWIRVAQTFAGKRWGASFWPRLGQEVLVAFVEGNPDEPVIVGIVYNADQMPPYLGSGLDSKHKDDPNVSGIKSNTTIGGSGFNEFRFDDTKDKEQIFLHAERNLEITTKNDSLEHTFNNRHQIIGQEKNGSKTGDQREWVRHEKHITVDKDHIEHVGGNMQLLIGGIDGDGNQDIVVQGSKKESVGKDDHLHVTGDRNEKIDGSQSLTVGAAQQEKIGTKHAVDAGQEIHLKAGMTVVIEAGMQLTIKAGSNFIDIGPTGVAIQGTMVMINSGGAAGSGSGSSPTSPQDPAQANPTKPDESDDSKSGQKSSK
ncbi:MAG TPA: type VI secretion system tip protein TssI/VgrG [Chthoniobacterales bacterium]|nr:type VI secretion system tip protein TssI/VgrG [Chthoniobacterales bacterium]